MGNKTPHTRNYNIAKAPASSRSQLPRQKRLAITAIRKSRPSSLKYQGKKIIIIGLDGMSPKLFNILVRKRIFITLGKIRKKGVYSELLSTLPPVTAPAWTTFATGVNPGKHGIYDFFTPRDSLSKMWPVSALEIKKLTFYQILTLHKIPSILVNLPVSWPPLTQNPTITSLLTRGDDVVFPKYLLRKIPRLKHYKLIPENLAKVENKKNNVELVKEIRSMEKNRFEVFMQLTQLIQWEAAFLLFSGSDWLSHRFYGQLVAGTAPAEVWQFFGEIDSYVSKILDVLGDISDVLILSDHGFKVVKKQFAINQWLFDKGYLARRRVEESRRDEIQLFARPRALDLTRLRFLLDIPFLSNFLVRFYKLVGRYLPFAVEVKEEVDSRRTVARATQWGIYLNLKERFEDGWLTKEEGRRLALEIKRQLKLLRDKQGSRVFKSVFLKEEIYHGNMLNKAPDIVFCPGKDWQIIASLNARKIFDARRANDHERKGIFLAWGRNIKTDSRLAHAELQDVCPTILCSLGIPLPKYFDGEPLNVFRGR